MNDVCLGYSDARLHGDVLTVTVLGEDVVAVADDAVPLCGYVVSNPVVTCTRQER